ncbi:hypothetical protein J5N97_019310 [Dioscorea zingiberensis]|uniref:Uncharacterized protein n=1 Tax=Dioscorea zingiberensis TaxID=325984 RepID=A0A9D5CDR9_9LILI|nr:hypothetical protein J5N97_019310 [Dioscorea zingiberensis]
MHLWRVNANEFSYEDLVDCIHDMEFGKVEKMHYRVPNSGRSLETSLIILHSEESFANLAKHLKSNIPIEVYAAAAKGKGKASHASTGPGQNVDSRSTNKKKAHAKSKHATATSRLLVLAKGPAVAEGAPILDQVNAQSPAADECPPIQDQDRGDDAADIQGQDNAGIDTTTKNSESSKKRQRDIKSGGERKLRLRKDDKSDLL